MIGALASLISNPAVLSSIGDFAAQAMQKMTPTISKWLGIGSSSSDFIAGISPESIKNVRDVASAKAALKKLAIKIPRWTATESHSEPHTPDDEDIIRIAKEEMAAVANNHLPVVVPNSVMNQTMLNNENLSMQSRPVPVAAPGVESGVDKFGNKESRRESLQFGVRRIKGKGLKAVVPASVDETSFTASKQFALGGGAPTSALAARRRNKMLKSGLY